MMPSFQEGFAQVPLEALACGVPVVAFPCSGTEELINNRNGVRTSDFTVNSLSEGIKQALLTNYDKKWIRKDIITRYGVSYIIDKYLDIYNTIT